ITTAVTAASNIITAGLTAAIAEAGPATNSAVAWAGENVAAAVNTAIATAFPGAANTTGAEGAPEALEELEAGAGEGPAEVTARISGKTACLCRRKPSDENEADE
ncbi:uncharacterized protein E0L32_010578, partial [Thyridium curvatum]